MKKLKLLVTIFLVLLTIAVANIFVPQSAYSAVKYDGGSSKTTKTTKTSGKKATPKKASTTTKSTKPQPKKAGTQAKSSATIKTQVTPTLSEGAIRKANYDAVNGKGSYDAFHKANDGKVLNTKPLKAKADTRGSVKTKKTTTAKVSTPVANSNDTAENIRLNKQNNDAVQAQEVKKEKIIKEYQKTEAYKQDKKEAERRKTNYDAVNGTGAYESLHKENDGKAVVTKNITPTNESSTKKKVECPWYNPACECGILDVACRAKKGIEISGEFVADTFMGSAALESQSTANYYITLSQTKATWEERQKAAPTPEEREKIQNTINEIDGKRNKINMDNVDQASVTQARHSEIQSRAVVAQERVAVVNKASIKIDEFNSKASEINKLKSKKNRTKAENDQLNKLINSFNKDYNSYINSKEFKDAQNYSSLVEGDVNTLKLAKAYSEKVDIEKLTQAIREGEKAKSDLESMEFSTEHPLNYLNVLDFPLSGLSVTGNYIGTLATGGTLEDAAKSSIQYAPGIWTEGFTNACMNVTGANTLTCTSVAIATSIAADPLEAIGVGAVGGVGKAFNAIKNLDKVADSVDVISVTSKTAKTIRTISGARDVVSGASTVTKNADTAIDVVKRLDSFKDGGKPLLVSMERDRTIMSKITNLFYGAAEKNIDVISVSDKLGADILGDGLKKGKILSADDYYKLYSEQKSLRDGVEISVSAAKKASKADVQNVYRTLVPVLEDQVKQAKDVYKGVNKTAKLSDKIDAYSDVLKAQSNYLNVLDGSQKIGLGKAATKARIFGNDLLTSANDLRRAGNSIGGNILSGVKSVTKNDEGSIASELLMPWKMTSRNKTQNTGQYVQELAARSDKFRIEMLDFNTPSGGTLALGVNRAEFRGAEGTITLEAIMDSGKGWFTTKNNFPPLGGKRFWPKSGSNIKSHIEIGNDPALLRRIQTELIPFLEKNGISFKTIAPHNGSSTAFGRLSDVEKSKFFTVADNDGILSNTDEWIRLADQGQGTKVFTFYFENEADCAAGSLAIDAFLYRRGILLESPKSMGNASELVGSSNLVYITRYYWPGIKKTVNGINGRWGVIEKDEFKALNKSYNLKDKNQLRQLEINYGIREGGLQCEDNKLYFSNFYNYDEAESKVYLEESQRRSLFNLFYGAGVSPITFVNK